ncbi:flagellar basal body-associated FliL family protein [Desulfovibrio litoralis]|uniref:Flagellar protein FliL n=1 Tax=Desulfovibrio litoralis DSM 11393 TaxID=1121455 RepID=A0A1M7TD00_9BACT|nr:flagellar basal body-associated FliL family protein [Desulfovibrio litoralis]SHN68556.1 flagellar FliL protein [Desulfovibrio litoralis DSM 11393]
MPDKDEDFLSDLGSFDSKEPTKTAAPDLDLDLESNNAKVALDLDDAPFLEQEKAPKQEEKKPSPPSAEKVSMQQPEKQQAESDVNNKSKRKKLIIIGGAVVVLLLVGVGLFLFLSGGEQTEEPKELHQPVVEPQPKEHGKAPAEHKPATNSSTPAKPELSLMEWEPFVIEKKDRDGKIVFLYTKFTVATEDQKLLSEMNSKKVILRDAIFFFLENKELIYLSDPTAVSGLKRELLNVINEKLQHGELKDILIENYLIK